MTEKLEGQVTMFDLDTWSGRTCPEASPLTKEKTSKRSSRKSSGSSSRIVPMCLCLKKESGQSQDASMMTWGGGQLLGEYTTLSFGECPREENGSRLSQILEDSPHQKYYLSAKACQGILDRAKRRGKQLPPELEMALIAQSRTENKDILKTPRGGQGWEHTEVADTLNAFDTGETRAPVIVVEPRSQDGTPRVRCDVSPTLNSCGGVSASLALSFQEREGKPGGGKGILIQYERAGALSTVNNQKVYRMQSFGQYITSSSSSIKGRDSKDATDLVVEHDNRVRRFTPKEYERLQGYPDDWTAIGDWVDKKGKKRKTADTPRYKALGNSIALPFWFYLLRRISAQYERPATLGSLFDGIGGFPLCWERCNGEGTALWASEIEEFPIAVTKKRFSETKVYTH